MTVWWQQACTISLSGSTMVITSLMSHEIQSFYRARWSSSLKRGWKFRPVRMIQPPELMRPCYLCNSCHNSPVLWPILSGFCVSSCILNQTRHPFTVNISQIICCFWFLYLPQVLSSLSEQSLWVGSHSTDKKSHSKRIPLIQCFRSLPSIADKLRYHFERENK